MISKTVLPWLRINTTHRDNVDLPPPSPDPDFI